MTEIIKPGETLATPQERLMVQVDDLIKSVEKQGELLHLFDQYLLMNKKFFDQIKIDVPQKDNKKK